MDFATLKAISDETERTKATYELFCEETRLTRSPAARVEFLTSVRVIGEYLFPGARIADIGAGAGEYSFYFAKQGHPVTALELSPRNAEAFRARLDPALPVELIEGNALDLSPFADESFDAVLLMGPLYHLQNPEDRLRCLREAMRVCKRSGTIFCSMINNDMVILTEFGYRPQFFGEQTYDHETFQVENFPFVFFTLDQCRALLREAGLTIVREVAADGVSELMEDAINALSEADYAQYLRYHFYCCEKPEMLGRTNHLLFAAKKSG